jgi:hypothetical protein
MTRLLVRVSRRGVLLLVTLSGGIFLGTGTSIASTRYDECPGDDACYRAKDCKTGCKNNQCTTQGSQCPDPSATGKNCYVCAAVE